MAAPGKKFNGRILLVDDDALILAQVSDTLKAQGYAVITSTNPLKAIEIAKFDTFNLILADINMPPISGLEFRDKLRADSRTAGVPFAFLTSADTVENRRIARELGARGFLQKPANPVLLLALVRGAVAQSTIEAAAGKQEQERAKKLLEKFKFKTELHPDGFRIVARVKIGRDDVTFSVVDAKTIRLESLNRQSLDAGPAEGLLRVDISHATSGVDIEIELETLIQQNRAALVPPANAVESKSVADVAYLSAEEDELPVFRGTPAAPPPAPRAAPAVAAPPPKRSWLAPPPPPPPSSPGTMFHCGTCNSMYVLGDDVADERLLSQCSNCIAKS